MESESVIDVDADSVASGLSEKKKTIDVIDLLSSSDDESGDDEEKGGVSVTSILREHYPEMLDSESEEHQQENQGVREKEKSGEVHGETNASIYSSNSSLDEEKESLDFGESQSLEFLRNHCWGCHIWVDHPAFESDESNDNICYNALHLHPILAVPTCVVCAEIIEAVERNQGPGRARSNLEKEGSQNELPTRAVEGKKEDTSTACNTCGGFEFDENQEEYVRCDACQRAVCPNCYEQAHHSLDGKDGKLTSSLRKRPRPTSVQTCFCCSSMEISSTNEDIVDDTSTQNSQSNERVYHDLPPFLEKLRGLTQQLFSCSDWKTKESAEDMIDQLNTLEIEKRSCETYLDNPNYLLDMIREEMSEELSDVEDDIFEIRVEERYLQRRQEWIHHQTRLMDRITIIGDQLKAGYGLEAAAVLRYIEVSNNASETREHDNDESASEEGEPLYKVAADYELSKRDRDERLKRRKEDKLLARKSGADPKYLVELTADAEDLGTIDDVDSTDDGETNNDDKADAYDNGWRNAPFKARKQDIEAAMKAEDKRRYDEGKMNLIRCSKVQDAEEMKKWDSGLKSSAVIVKKKSKKRKRLTTRTGTTLKGRNPSTTTIAAVVRSPQRYERKKIKDGNSGLATFEESAGDTNCVFLEKSKALEYSDFVLSKDPLIYVPRQFERHLKNHQKDGIKFMYESTFADLGQHEPANIGGCILAHSMGLGKSLSCVSILYTIMTPPSLYDSEVYKQKIHKTLLVVPVNTIANWDNEFEKWTEGMAKGTKLGVFNVSRTPKHERYALVQTWSSVGGVLLTSTGLFRSMAQRDDTGELLRATDLVVLDESHTMLKNKESKVYKALMQIRTCRRICLTGTPFQNNLLEYFRMISFIRPNILVDSEKNFQKAYVDPIQSGMASDAADHQKTLADKCLAKFVDTVGTFVHRRDASLLRKDLPSLQQVCLHVPPTKVQRIFYGAFRQHQERTNEKNFLKQYSALRTVHNHPGTLLFRNENPSDSEDKKQSPDINYTEVESLSQLPKIKTEPIDADLTRELNNTPKVQNEDCIIEILSSDDEDDDIDENYEPNNKWWTKAGRKLGAEKMKHIESGNKCIVLLHILAHASKLGEKTVVFSQSLKTLDFLSEVLASKDWQILCPSLLDSFPDLSMGGWILGKDFLRIDGGTSGFERGELLKDFSGDDSVKLFLISSVAGGIGINLVSASRVVLFDSHFNPTIDLQAVFRCYRYGQIRNVFSYRLLTQGTMEEKVYSRAMNKTSLGSRLIDGKKLHRCFEQDEIEDLAKVDDWVECTRCKKWRMFPSNHNQDITNVADDWHCRLMNAHDARMEWSCAIEEKDSVWYYQHFKKPNRKLIASGLLGADTESRTKLSAAESKELVEKDEILKNILAITSRTDNSVSIVSKHYFHGKLLTDVEEAKHSKNI